MAGDKSVAPTRLMRDKNVAPPGQPISLLISAATSLAIFSISFCGVPSIMTRASSSVPPATSGRSARPTPPRPDGAGTAPPIFKPPSMP